MEADLATKAARHTTARIMKMAISKPHSSETKAKTRSVSEAATYLSQPRPAPRPKRPPEAMHIMERVCW